MRERRVNAGDHAQPGAASAPVERETLLRDDPHRRAAGLPFESERHLPGRAWTGARRNARRRRCARQDQAYRQGVRPSGFRRVARRRERRRSPALAGTPPRHSPTSATAADPGDRERRPPRRAAHQTHPRRHIAPAPAARSGPAVGPGLRRKQAKVPPKQFHCETVGSASESAPQCVQRARRQSAEAPRTGVRRSESRAARALRSPRGAIRSAARARRAAHPSSRTRRAPESAAACPCRSCRVGFGLIRKLVRGLVPARRGATEHRKIARKRPRGRE